jgi:hypothetical protein
MFTGAIVALERSQKMMHLFNTAGLAILSYILISFLIGLYHKRELNENSFFEGGSVETIELFITWIKILFWPVWLICVAMGLAYDLYRLALKMPEGPG